ncbi:MAG: DUF6600 domain-containing protein [Steroidobacteraceae bacterium]
MSDSRRLLALTALLLFSLCLAPVSRADYDDPSGRVARLSNSQGYISYSPGGEDDWMDIERNRPLIRGDRLWTDRDARAEFQMGNAAVRLGPDTSFEILNLDDDFAQMRLAQGTVNLRVRRMYPGQVYEIATPALSFTINRAGRYRIDVDPYDDVTTIVVWEGAGEAYGEDRGYRLRAGDTVRFYGSDLRDHEMYGLPRADAFDRYCFDRDQRLDRSVSLRYVDDDLVGYSDLDDYGDWRTVNSLGTVWFPRRLDADWAPYRDGHWVWLEPWGWTWIDAAPWGFAPSHYGRWVHVSNRWGWIPGQRNVRSIYSPALVVFIGGRGWNQSRGSGGSSPIGWFPLGPREVYVPSYRASRDYFTRVNVNNTVINNTTITNVYNNYSSGDINVRQVTYANRQVAGAVTAVPTDVFVNAKPVRAAKIRLDSKILDTGEVTRVAEVAPSTRSVLGTTSVAKARPPREATERRVIARKVPPAAPAPFAAREQQLKRTPGRAPEAGVAEPAPGRDVSAARKVRVVEEKQSVADVSQPPAQRAGGNSQAQAPAPAQLQPLDRSVKPGKGRGRDKAKDGPATVKPGTPNAQQQSNRQEPAAQAQGQPQGQRERQAAERQQEELRRQAECEAAAERLGGSAIQANKDKCKKKDDKASD